MAAAQAVRREGPAVEAADRARAERTINMPYMAVTLEVSKLSGWLNADAPCRESKGGHPLGGELREGRWQAAGDRSAQTQRAR